MTTILLLLLVSLRTLDAFQPPQVVADNFIVEKDDQLGQFVELRAGDTLELRCFGRFAELSFQIPDLTDHMGFDEDDFNDRFTQTPSDSGDHEMKLINVKESDTGRYECFSVSHPSLNSSIYVFVNDQKTFVPLTDTGFMEKQGEVYVRCKTSKFVSPGDVELRMNQKRVKNAKNHFSSEYGFKLIPKMYSDVVLKEIPFTCAYKDGEAVTYIVTEEGEVLDDISDDDFELSWVESIPWPYIGAPYMIGCKLHYKGLNKYDHFFQHRLEVSCPRCTSDSEDVTVVGVKFDDNAQNGIIRKIEVNNLTSKDKGEYSCDWHFEGRTEPKRITKELEISQTKEFIRILNRTSEAVQIREGEPIILNSFMQIVPDEEGRRPSAKWIRKFTSPLRTGNQSEVLISGDALTITNDITDTTFSERLKIDGTNTRTNISGTYLLQVEYVDTVLNIEWQVAVKNVGGDVVIAIREPSEFVVLDQQFYPVGKNLHIDCLIQSLPPADITVKYKKHKSDAPFVDVDVSELEEAVGTFENGFVWDKEVKEDIDVQCSAERAGKKIASVTKTIQVAHGEPNTKVEIKKSDLSTKMENDKEILAGDQVILYCIVPNHEDWRVRWEYDGDQLSTDNIVRKSELVVTTTLDNVQVRNSGQYECVVSANGKEKILKREITVKQVSKPHHKNSDPKEPINLHRNEDKVLECNLEGDPIPDYKWFKDGSPVDDTEVDDDGRLLITRAQREDAGMYDCVATNRAGSTSSKVYVKFHGPHEGGSIIGWWFGVVLLGFIALSIYCLLLQRKSKKVISNQQQRLIELYDQLTRDHSEVEPESVKKLPIDQRVTQLNYNTDYEISKDCLQYDTKHLLGSGNFGKVFKGALSRSRVTSEASERMRLPVAVKAPRNGYDVTQQRMLVDELKVLCAIGNHPNILSLVGAVTKNMKNGELLVVVEFCENGNIRDYLRKNKTGFIDELRSVAETSDGYLAPASSSRPKYAAESDKDWENHRLMDESKVLCTSDLISFSMQIARGMEYLASLPCMHRDLAARNVLLTSRNIVRVADFGMAKNDNKKEYYRVVKSKNLEVPIRWMSIEAITDKKYTQESDVWAFAIVLYEIFTLGGNPYPNLREENIVDHILEGNINPKPKYCHDKIYELMLQCWEKDPKMRPNFSYCAKFLKEHLTLSSPQHLETVEKDILLEAKAQKELKKWLSVEEEEDPRVLATPSDQPTSSRSEERYQMHNFPLPN